MGFCIFFRAYSWLRSAGDVLLCCYSVVCSTFSIYYGIKKDIFLLKNVGYSILVMFIATVNVFISNYKDVGGSRANVFIALSVLIVIYATFKSFSNVLKLIVMGWWS